MSNDTEAHRRPVTSYLVIILNFIQKEGFKSIALLSHGVTKISTYLLTFRKTLMVLSILDWAIIESLLVWEPSCSSPLEREGIMGANQLGGVAPHAVRGGGIEWRIWAWHGKWVSCNLPTLIDSSWLLGVPGREKRFKIPDAGLWGHIFTLQENAPPCSSDLPWEQEREPLICQSVFGPSMAMRSEKYSHCGPKPEGLSVDGIYELGILLNWDVQCWNRVSGKYNWWDYYIR